MNTITKEEVEPQGDYSFKRYMEYDSGLEGSDFEKSKNRGYIGRSLSK